MRNEHTRESLIEEIKRVALALSKNTVSRTEFIRESGISEWHVLKHFDSWNDLVRSAGLQPTDVSRIPDEELFAAMYRTFVDEKGVTTRTRFRKVCQYSDYVYSKRWGTWDNVLLEFRKWVAVNHSYFPYLDKLPSPQMSSESVQEQAQTSDATREATAWPRCGGRLYGSVINFRGLQHAPINEQGVVFLFGMVALELGFIVESVTIGFPDCEAKRCVSRKQNLWERVRIEFEYQSRTFRDHGHNPDQCDLIVCWEDNWPDCPIEVLELRSAIDALEK
jgi:hypothetical protein